MKPDKHFVAAAGIVIVAVCLILLTWVGTMRAIHAQRLDTTGRVSDTLANQALVLAEEINRQILAIDQTLRILATAWQNNPGGFDLEAWRRQSAGLDGLSRDVVLTDASGIIRQSSVNEAVNQDARGLDFFRVLADLPANEDRMYIGHATIDGLMRQWHMNVARALHHPDGSFAGVIDADYRIAAITAVFAQIKLGVGSLVTLVGLDDGKLRGTVGSATVDPDASIGDTAMFAAIRDADSGIWTGPSANDAVLRIHAFHHLPGQNLVVVVAMTQQEAMQPAVVWRDQAAVFAGCITALLIALAFVLVLGIRQARRWDASMAEDRIVLAGIGAQLAASRALAAARAEQLEAILDPGPAGSRPVLPAETRSMLPAEPRAVLPARSRPVVEGSGSTATGVDVPRRAPPRTQVLLIADLAANQAGLASLLRREGHQVDIAEHESAAVKAAQTAPHDVIFVDTALPGMSVQDVTRTIRSLPGPARCTPIIALTAAGRENEAMADDVISATAAICGVLGKPVSAADLREALDRYVWFAHRRPGSTSNSSKTVAPPEPSGCGFAR